MNATTTRTEKIASIIDKRRPLAQKIESVEANLNSLSSALRNLDDRRHNLLTRVDDSNVATRLQEIDLAKIQSNIAAELEALGKLKMRFCRDTLNIGVVGLMGQGKSTLLQSLSGLTDTEIPARRGGACTAVRSMIYHVEGETFAEVTLHSEDSFRKEVIDPYYKELGLGATPTTLDDFAKPLPPLTIGDATKHSMYDHLQKDYHQNLKQYRPLLKAGSPRKLSSIPSEQIQEYIVQKRNGQGELITFKHLVVREVNIYCSFNNPEVGKIALVDVPGLGDTRLGDEKLMLETLGQEVDLVLFVRRPDPMRYGWEKRDTDLYKTASEALHDLANRSFMILNQVAGIDNNSDACVWHRKTISDKHINVVQCETADCSNPEQTNQILDSVLDYLTNHIDFIDQQYASCYQEYLLRLQGDVNAELDKARNAIGEVAEDEEYALFDERFEELWKAIKENIHKSLLTELRDKRDEEDIDFKENIDEALKKCEQDTGVPSIIEINRSAAIQQGYPNAYYDYLNKIRAHISKHFLYLDQGLERSLEKVKSQVTEALVVVVEGGCLGELTPKRGSEFIKEMAEQIPEQVRRGKPSELKQGFQILATFNLSYRGLIQHRIRKHFDELTPNTNTVRLSDSPTAEEIEEILTELQKQTLYDCKKALNSLFCEPSQAAFAIVEEFFDRVFSVEDIKSEWRIFLRQVRAKVWRDDFGRLVEYTKLRQEWLNSVEKVADANKLDSMQFLN